MQTDIQEIYTKTILPLFPQPRQSNYESSANFSLQFSPLIFRRNRFRSTLLRVLIPHQFFPAKKI